MAIQSSGGNFSKGRIRGDATALVYLRVEKEDSLVRTIPRQL
jgi:hypothetical protein